MKANILIITAIMLVLSSQTNAQIKIHDDNHVSLGSMTKAGGFQMQPEGYIYHQPTYTASWAWYSNTYALNPYSKINIVTYNNQHKYYVRGDGKVFSNGYYSMSDITLKEHIEKIESPLDKIRELNGVSFDFIREPMDTIIVYDENGEPHIIIPDDPYEDDLEGNEYVSEEAKPAIIAERDRKHLGFIAQEVENILPEVVRTTPDGKKTIAYDEIIAICVEAIKELEQKTSLQTNLQNRIFQLTKLTNDLQSQIDDLKQKTSQEKSFGFGEINEDIDNPSKANLYQNSPNPYSVKTIIKCTIPNIVQSASINIYDLNGTQIKTIQISKRGDVSITVQSSELIAGMYLYSLITDNVLIDTKNMVLTSQ